MHVSEAFGKGRYTKQLGDQRWASKARAFKGGRSNTCEKCHRGDKATHVHHVWYDHSLAPWDHPDDALMLLCRDCHRALHAGLKEFRGHVFRGLTPQALRVLNGALAVGVRQYDPLALAYAIAEMVASPGSVARFAAAWHPDANPPSASPYMHPGAYGKPPTAGTNKESFAASSR